MTKVVYYSRRTPYKISMYLGKFFAWSFAKIYIVNWKLQFAYLPCNQFEMNAIDIQISKTHMA